MPTFNYRLAAVVVLLVACCAQAVAASTKNQYLELAAGYSKGDFYTGNNASIYRLQASYGYIAKQYDINITVPYLFLRDDFGNENGPGDVIARIGKTFTSNISPSSQYYAALALKLPTADESSGLGTGAADLGAFINYTHRFNKLELLLMGGYIVTGDSSQQVYNDIFVYGIGLSRRINPWYFYGSVEGRQQLLATGNNPAELNIGSLYQLKQFKFVKAEAFIGLNNASPDFGISVGIINWF